MTYHWYGNGMLKGIVKPSGEHISFEYDALGRRTAKINHTAKSMYRYVWDGNVILHEWKYALSERPSLSVNEKGELSSAQPEPTENIVTWVYEEGSFVPSAKLVGKEKYSIISDYIGKPTHAYNSIGDLVWSAEYDIYGDLRNFTGDKHFIPFRQLGQYEDTETGLYYNRFRYYSPDTGTYISQDPIGLFGGDKFYAYVSDTNTWVDINGLNSSTLNKNLAGTVRDQMQAHHIIPEEIWKVNKDFLDEIGLDGQMDKATNGILLPDRASGIGSGGPQIVHRGCHPEYSAEIGGRVTRIRDAYNKKLIDKNMAKTQIIQLQGEYRTKLFNGDVPNKVVDGKKKLH